MMNSRWRPLVTRMEPRVSDQISFILRRRDWQNSSLILDFFTRDHGCIRAIARGARRNPAKTPYQPFVMLSISWTGRQELKTLIGIEGQALPVDEKNYLALLYVNELLGALLPQGESNPAIFASYQSLLQQSERNGQKRLLLLNQRISLSSCQILHEHSSRNWKVNFTRIKISCPICQMPPVNSSRNWEIN